MYDSTDSLMEYISGSRTRSWRLLGRDDAPFTGWCQVQPEDVLAIKKNDRVTQAASFGAGFAGPGCAMD